MKEAYHIIYTYTRKKQKIIKILTNIFTTTTQNYSRNNVVYFRLFYDGNEQPGSADGQRYGNVDPVPQHHGRYLTADLPLVVGE